ncbi:uncharacterized protein LOC128233950 isoform X2 [Mya arenaria]|uniref:uncharacterized protein LOC128233950 isoform X2 n=1 Tax=Mya arenaria TaxID=6604 RepID=UPI0022DEBCE3|nr:uncharacterized protein LOC128233950 isoform X2 [Mya arenaria]
MTQCSACAIQCNEEARSCPKCLKTYCSSCNLLKHKLEASTGRRRNCKCSQLIALRANEVSKPNGTGNLENNREFTGQALKDDTTPEKPKGMQYTAINPSKPPELSQQKAGIAQKRGVSIPPGNTTPGRQCAECESDSKNDNKCCRVVPMKSQFNSGNSSCTYCNKSYSNSSNFELQDSEDSYSLADFSDDELIAEDLNMDKFDEIPPYDEIPYALIWCGVYDEQSIRIAQTKQMQKKLLKDFQKESKIPSRVNKNGQIQKVHQKHKDTEKELNELMNGLKDIAEENSSKNNEKPENALFETRQHQEAETETEQLLSKPLQSTSMKNEISNSDSENPPFRTCSESLETTRNSKKSTAYKHKGDNSNHYLKNNEYYFKNTGSTIPETKKDVKRPPSPIAIKSSSDGKNTKSNCPSCRYESEQERSMREKRLQKFQQDRKSARAGSRNTQKLDNRDLAPNTKPLSKPIKCKAFKHKSAVEVLNQEQDDKHDNQTHHELPCEVKQENVLKVRDNSTRTVKADEKPREILETQQNSSSNDIDSNDDSVVPTAMRALHISKGKDKASKSVRDSNDDSVVPTAMRALHISKGKDKASKSKRDLTDSFLGNILSKATDKIKPALKGSEEQNENKSYFLSSFGTSSLKEKVSKPCMSDKEKQTFIDTIESTLEKKAESLHSAFEYLRNKQSRLPKCPACGSTDCKEKNGAVQELVVAAKKEGYEVHDVCPDGNCMFTALVDQLEMYGDTRFDARSLRETAVNWLKEHPRLNDGENTHFQSFMDEDWDAYLQRMILDGEWGDHLQLRAVSNVVGSTIKVLSTRNRDVVWKSIPSGIDTHPSDRVLTIGNVSERHYSSLWPSGRNLESWKFDKQLPLEAQRPERLDTYKDTAEVAMFASDYVDPESGVPSCHLSFLLNAVAPRRTVLNVSAIISLDLLDGINRLIEQCNFPKETVPVPVGSITEGTFHPSLCWLEGKEDEMQTWLNSCILIKLQLLKDIVWGEEGSYCHFGYTGIINTSQTIHGNMRTFHDSSYYRKRSSNIPFLFRCTQPKAEGSVPMMLEYCVPISKWPDQAREWLIRKRYQNWPPQHIRSEIESKGCVLSASCHPASNLPHIEWKYLFAEAETILFKEALSEHQMYCYLIFRYFCLQKFNEVKLFNIDIPNSIFFFSCERIPCEVWETSVAGCLIFMMSELQSGIRKRGIPHYFIAKNNMIDHFSEEDIHLVEERLCQFLSQPLLHIRNLNESLNELRNCAFVFERVSDDLKHFSNVKTSTLQVFIPCQIEIAQNFIRHFYYERGLEKLNEAFLERLAVSTCDDSMSFQVFLQAAFSGLDFAATVWFALFADKMLHGQLSKTLMREVCSDLHLLRIDEVLPKDVAGVYAESEVPVSFTLAFDSFCHDYAAFLAFAEKKTEAIIVLEFCAKKHRLYQSHLKEMTEAGIVVESRAFKDGNMFCVYAAIFALYNKEQENEKFCEYSDEASELVKRMKRGYALSWLSMVFVVLYGEAGLKRLADQQTNSMAFDIEMSRTFLYWPLRYLMA